MHPTVISDKPGVCPVCAMDLVKKARPGTEVQITEDLSKLIKSPNETVIASINTINGEFKSVNVSLQAQGVVTYDTRRIFTIPSRVSGRLEKVFIKHTFQQIRKGQKIAEIYSPELLTAQRELIFLLDNDVDNQQLIQSARERLKLLGASTSQINSITQNKALRNTFTIYSPYDGYVIPEMQSSTGVITKPPAYPGSVGDEMGTSPAPTSSPASMSTVTGDALIREGSYVSAGQTLFRVVDPSALLVELNIASTLAASVKKGGKVMLDFGDDHTEEGTIDFVQPFFSEGQQFLTARVYTKKRDLLHIGQLVNATIHSGTVEALWVPKNTVVHLGIDDVVFVREKGVFKPRKITTGVCIDNQIEIKQGLSSSDEIAGNAQYLVDSESFIKPTR